MTKFLVTYSFFEVETFEVDANDEDDAYEQAEEKLIRDGLDHYEIDSIEEV